MIEAAWIWVCDRHDDLISIQAVSLVIQKFDFDKLVPVINIIRHYNKRWLNTYTSSTHGGITVIVRTSRTIELDEEMYTLQNLCDDFEGKKE